MRVVLALFLLFPFLLFGRVQTGIEVLFSPEYQHLLKGKRLGLITNQTGVTSRMEKNIDFIITHSAAAQCTLVALFAPEHGLTGASHAFEEIKDSTHGKIPVYSLHGKTRRPTHEMLKGIDILLFDIQDIGSRPYTYISTLFYAMEEAAKVGIPVIVTDRPNPINGVVVEGPLLDPDFRSFLGYVNVPYCHGMTVGELARLFNGEYKVGCALTVIPMHGWKRNMSFIDTGLPWVPTSPNVPEPTTPYYFPITGTIGELQLVSIGIGYTLPFKVVGAPWIDAEKLATHLNGQKLPGIAFQPFHFKPYHGRYSGEECHGVLIVVQDPLHYQPVMAQYTLLGSLKSLYPKEFAAAIEGCQKNKTLFHKVNGTDKVYTILTTNPYPAWPLRDFARGTLADFIPIRQKYLITSY